MKQQTLIIVGGGFAGVFGALAAARERRRTGARLEIALVSAEEHLAVRPRFYEEELGTARVALSAVLDPVGVRYVRGRVSAIDAERRCVRLDAGGAEHELAFDALLLAAGSRGDRSAVIGPVHRVDAFGEAARLRAHLDAVVAAGRPDALRAVVIGGEFTGLEVATELVGRLRRRRDDMGASDEITVTIVEARPRVADAFGPSARALIEQALGEQCVHQVVGARVVAVSDDGVRLEDGRLIAAATAIAAVGHRPSPLTGELDAPRDELGRLRVDTTLQVAVHDGIFAAGDVAAALADGDHRSLMTCQHAIPQGKIAGANAVRMLAGQALRPYQQPLYVTCLDLGEAGALLTEGWERERVVAFGQDARQFKRMLNRSRIYPPVGQGAERLLAAGRPDPQNNLSAFAARRALASPTLRHLVTDRTPDIATTLRAA